MEKVIQTWRKRLRSIPLICGVVFLCALICTPLFFILHESFQPPTEGWIQISETDPGGLLSKLDLEEQIPEHSLLYERSKTTLLLLSSVLGISSLLGISLAWLINRWQFPFRRTIGFLLVLPLTIPSYIMATSYKLLTVDYKNQLLVKIRQIYGAEVMSDWDQYWNFLLASLVLSAAFYPYVYLAARAAFGNISLHYLESSQVLGVSKSKTFLKIILPLSRPAIIAGMMLVCIETLNEFGAMKILGIDTLTTQIFYAWVNLEDKNTAIRLAGCIMLILLGLLITEHFLRGGRRYHASRSAKIHEQPIPIGLGKKIVVLVISLFVIFLTFVAPLYQLITLASRAIETETSKGFLPLITHSITLAGKASLAILFTSLFLAYAIRIFPYFWMQILAKISTLGYAIPGAILGICTISSVSFVKQQLHHDTLLDFFFYGSSYGLILAYLVRFLAIGFPPLDSGLKQINHHLDEAAQSLKHGHISTVIRIHIPLLKLSISAALLMLFIDILKELPLTLILNPSNNETLATKTYSLFAVEERYATGAIPALVLVMTGIIGLLIAHSFFNKRSTS